VQDSHAETAGTPDPLVGDPNNPLAGPPNRVSADPNDRGNPNPFERGSEWNQKLDIERGTARIADASTGSVAKQIVESHRDLPEGVIVPLHIPTARALTTIGFERQRQIDKYTDESDDTLTEFDWATRRQTYELRLAHDVSEPSINVTQDALVKLAALCVAQLEALDRRGVQIASASTAGSLAYRDVVEHRVDRDGFRITREFARGDLPSISVFIRAEHLPVSKARLAAMGEEEWRQVVRDAAAPSLDTLTEHEIRVSEHLREANGKAQRETEQL
jgi:hypothetical protein